MKKYTHLHHQCPVHIKWKKKINLHPTSNSSYVYQSLNWTHTSNIWSSAQRQFFSLRYERRLDESKKKVVYFGLSHCRHVTQRLISWDISNQMMIRLAYTRTIVTYINTSSQINDTCVIEFIKGNNEYCPSLIRSEQWFCMIWI